jgi:hypothetical protein
MTKPYKSNDVLPIVLGNSGNNASYRGNRASSGSSNCKIVLENIVIN